MHHITVSPYFHFAIFHIYFTPISPYSLTTIFLFWLIPLCSQFALFSIHITPILPYSHLTLFTFCHLSFQSITSLPCFLFTSFTFCQFPLFISFLYLPCSLFIIFHVCYNPFSPYSHNVIFLIYFAPVFPLSHFALFLIIWKNRSFWNRENLQYKKTADSLILSLFMRTNGMCNNSHAP